MDNILLVNTLGLGLCVKVLELEDMALESVDGKGV